MKARIKYFVIVCLIISIGLSSRSLDFIPLIIGDILYAMMIYFIMRFFFLKFRPIKIACIALVICFGIEFLQLYQAEWLVSIRNTKLGALVLGQGFLLSDLSAYFLGVSVAYFLEYLFRKKNKGYQLYN